MHWALQLIYFEKNAKTSTKWFCCEILNKRVFVGSQISRQLFYCFTFLAKEREMLSSGTITLRISLVGWLWKCKYIVGADIQFWSACCDCINKKGCRKCSVTPFRRNFYFWLIFQKEATDSSAAFTWVYRKSIMMPIKKTSKRLH